MRASLEGELVYPMMGLGGQRATLAGFEVHHLAAQELTGAGRVVGEYLLPPIGQLRDADPEAVVGRLGSRDRLEQQVHRGS